MWSIDGVFPLSPLLDSIGPLTRSTGQTVQIFETLTSQRLPEVRVDRLRFGLPSRTFFDDLDPEVKRCTDEAIVRLERAGVRIDAVDLPELDLVDPVFAKMITADLVATLGRERVEKHLDILDSVVRQRIAGGLEIAASDYIAMVRRCAVLVAAAAERMRGFDAWLTPTSPTIPLPVAECKTIEAAAAWNRRTLRNTRPGNVFGQCGVSLPIESLGSALPVGLQLLASGGDDARLLAIARCVEDTLHH